MRVLTLLASALCAGSAYRLQAQVQSPALGGAGASASNVTLEQYMQRVVDYNESVQSRLLAFLAARSQRKAEGGAFEPNWVTSGEFVDRKRANTIEVERSLRSGGEFTERNQNYSSAIEMQTPVGTRLRLGATAGKLINNIQRTVIFDLDAEYETSIGFSLEQPLLKGAGNNVALAALRVAARNSEVAYQDYRGQMMTVVAEAELAYWQLYYAQQEVRLLGESVTLAQTLVRDTSAAMDAGRGSRLDVLEAEAGLAMRRSRESLSAQRRIEALNRMLAFVGGSHAAGGASLSAAEAPVLRKVEILPEEGARVALAMNPDVLRTRAQAETEKIRVAFSRNQRLPELNLKSSVAASGLGFDWTSAWRDVERYSYPAWTAGLEMRIPLFGGVRGRNEYRAASFRLMQAERAMADITTKLRTGLDSAQKRIEAAFTSAQSYQAVVEFRSNLLQTRLQGREVGRLDSRSVLEAEQELFAARVDQLQSEIEYQRSLLDLQVISGSLLQSRGLEVGFNELEQRTNEWIKAPGEKIGTMHYQMPTIIRLPAFAPLPFEGDPDPVYPWRLRLSRPWPWQNKP